MEKLKKGDVTPYGKLMQRDFSQHLAFRGSLQHLNINIKLIFKKVE